VASKLVAVASFWWRDDEAYWPLLIRRR